MLRIEHLTKKYGDKKAVDDLSLHIQKRRDLRLYRTQRCRKDNNNQILLWNSQL